MSWYFIAFIVWVVFAGLILAFIHGASILSERHGDFHELIDDIKPMETPIMNHMKGKQ